MTESSNPTETKWYTIAEARAVLKVSENTLRKLIEDGQIPAVKVGPRLVRIPAKAVDEFEGAQQ